MRMRGVYNDNRELSRHVARTRRYCRIFAGRMAPYCYVDKLLLDCAAYYHDLAKLDDAQDHHKPRCVRDSARRRGTELPYYVLDIIKEHKGKFKPDDDIVLEAAILRICDKLDRYNKGKDDVDDKCRRSMRQIKTRFQQQDLALEWKVFQRVYREMRLEILLEAFLGTDVASVAP